MWSPWKQPSQGTRKRPSIRRKSAAASAYGQRLGIELLEDRTAPAVDLLSISDPSLRGTLGNSGSASAAISADGRYVTFMSDASNLVVGDTNGVLDVFRKDLNTGAIVRVSTDASAMQGNNSSFGPAISSDGRYVAFYSDASSLVAGDTNGAPDVFRKDLDTGAIVRVSTDASAMQGNNSSFGPAISSDGRYVAFASLASNLVAGDTNGAYDVFRKDLDTGAIVRVNTDASAVQSNGDSYEPAISSDGRYVAFHSDASNLVADDTNSRVDVFRKDLDTGAIVRVSTDAAVSQANGYSYDPAISADGRYVAFFSSAINLVVGDTNSRTDVFRKDLETGAIVRVSTDASAAQGNGDSDRLAMSSDGRFVAFLSYATNLVAGDTNGYRDVFRKDLGTGEIVGVSADASATQGNNSSNGVAISADGRYVAFHSNAANLVPLDTNSVPDAFRKDLNTGLVAVASQSFISLTGSSSSLRAVLSADGRYVAFQSYATNLVVGDSNGAADVFRKDLVTGAIVRVSTDASAAQGNGNSSSPAISNDGRYVAFISNATNLVAGDTNGTDDVFRKDLMTGAIVRVSTDALATQGNNSSIEPAISADGRYVAFRSFATNLVASDTNFGPDVFRKDLSTGAIVRISTDASGTQVYSDSLDPAISSDGRYVAFLSYDQNLVAGDTNGQPDVFRKDVVTGAIVRVSTDASAVQANHASFRPAISGDGRYIVFDSSASNLVAGDTNGQNDIFRKDLDTGVIVRVTAVGAAQSNSFSFEPAISSDGRYVAFLSLASNLVAGDTNGRQDVFRKDSDTGAIVCVSTNASAALGNNDSYDPAISGDGRYVAFRSQASNLISEDFNNADDVFVKDTTTGQLQLASNNPGIAGNLASNSSGQSVSADGRYVAFVSLATNLVVGDTNGNSDIFVRDRQTGTTIRVSTDGAATQANGDSYQPSISADGRYVAFFSYATNLVAGDTNSLQDVFRKDLITGAIVRVSTDGSASQANGGSEQPSISANGRYVAFFSSATNLVAWDSNGRTDVFRKDLDTGAILMVSNDAPGTSQGNGDSESPAISGDGRYVAFNSSATNLVAGDGNGANDVFRKDLDTGAIVRASVSAIGVQGNGISFQATISGDGRYIAFRSSASNLSASDANGRIDAFRKDMNTGAVVCVSTDGAGVQGNHNSDQPSISSDGRYVAFTSFADNLVAGDTNVSDDVFRKDLNTGAIVRISTDGLGVQGNNYSSRSSISGDGRYVAFQSDASNLVQYDLNASTDVFGVLLNSAPTALALAPASIAENQPSGATVGSFTTTDPDSGNTFTYTLAVGAGDTDNGSFAIVGNQLQTGASFNFEAQSSYSVRVRTTDQDGLWFESFFAITVTDVNESPTALALSNASVDENEPSGTVVGNLSTTDPDALNTFTYTLAVGAGDTDNGSFAIVGNQLQTGASFNFEAQSSYSVRVRTTDQDGLWFESFFAITVTDVNEAPTALALSNASVDENEPSGTVVGNLSTTDPDALNTFTYTLAVGAGDTDNGSFAIVGNQLQTGASFNFEAQSSYSVRVRTTDQDGLWFESFFAISVTDVNEAPTALALSNASVDENEPTGTAVGNLSSTDPDALNTFTYTLAVGAGDADNGSFAIVGNQLQTGASFNCEAQSSYSVRVRTTDQDGLWFESSFNISVTNVNEAPTAVFTPSRTLGRAALLVQFDAAASFDVDAGSGDSIVEYAWDWNGDGTYDQLTASPLVNHTFHQGGAFGVKLRVRDTGGLTHVSAPQVITVDPPSVTWVYSAGTNTLTITGGTFSETIVLAKDVPTGRIYIGGDIDDVTTAPAGATLKIVINSNGGNDRIDLSALTGAMYLQSSVNAGDGLDTVLGGGAADYINGGRGNDSLTGNGGADRFQFDMLDPTAVDSVMDFQDEVDKVDLTPYTQTLAYSSLNIVQDGADTVITLPNGQKIRLKNFNRALLAGNDFLFRAAPPGNRGQ